MSADLVQRLIKDAARLDEMSVDETTSESIRAHLKAKAEGVRLALSKAVEDLGDAGLSPDEHAAMKMTADLTNLMVGKVIGQDKTRSSDVGEFVQHIHVIQHMIMSQAAGRVYPSQYRLLGQIIPEPEPEKPITEG